jgi:hypothetical protein
MSTRYSSSQRIIALRATNLKAKTFHRLGKAETTLCDIGLPTHDRYLLEHVVDFVGYEAWVRPIAARGCWKLGCTLMKQGRSEDLGHAQALLSRAMQLRRDIISDEKKKEDDGGEEDSDEENYGEGANNGDDDGIEESRSEDQRSVDELVDDDWDKLVFYVYR